MRRAVTSILVVCGLGVSAGAHAQDQDPVRLPELDQFLYQPNQRDPFISSAAVRTILAGSTAPRGAVSGKAVQQYLRTITEAIQKELFVGGVSTGDEESRPMAIINGVGFTQGDKLPLPVAADQLLQLEALARTYGFPLSRSANQAILVEVGEIRTGGVLIILPGFKMPICELRYEGDNFPEQVQLERKRPSP